MEMQVQHWTGNVTETKLSFSAISTIFVAASDDNCVTMTTISSQCVNCWYLVIVSLERIHRWHGKSGFMMMSWHGIAFHNIDTLWGEYTGHWWIILPKGPWCGDLLLIVNISRPNMMNTRIVIDFQPPWDPCDATLMYGGILVTWKFEAGCPYVVAMLYYIHAQCHAIFGSHIQRVYSI